MGKCQACTFKHPNSGGWGPRCTQSNYGSNMGRGASTIKVYADDEDCLLTAWAGTDYTGRGMYLNVSNQNILNNLDARQRYHDDNWDNDPESIKVERIPSANQNQIEYHLPIKRYTPHKPGDNHCGGCRWWPDVKSGKDNPKNADRDDVLLKDINSNEGWSDTYVGRPCPGGKGYFNSKSGVKCIYSKSDANELRQLHNTQKNSFSGDPRKAMYTDIVNKYCNSAERLNDVISSDTSNNKCRDVVDSIKLAKEYCKIGDNIAIDSTFCTKEELGDDNYNELAKNYCENNPDKDFCGCYNVTQPGLCEQSPNLPGCKTVKPVWDKITSSLDEGDIAQFEGMQPCYGSVCSGNVYQPTSWDTSCNRDISICKADFDIGGDLVGSNISLKQDCGNNNEGGGGGGDGGGDGGGGDDEEKSLTEKLFKFEEDKDKKLTEKRSTKIFGTVSSVSSCFMCMTALVLFT